jgi:hypothetical protein
MSSAMTHIPVQYSYEACKEIIQGILKLIQLLVTSLFDLIVATIPGHRNPQKYHTSILSGYAWVLELITGHPNRIRCELGVSTEDFLALIAELCHLGHQDSRRVTLTEQVVIFLYMSVTGLTVRHVGERFQRSNDTISR